MDTDHRQHRAWWPIARNEALALRHLLRRTFDEAFKDCIGLLTLGMAIVILVSFALILIGPRLAEHIAYWTFLGPAFEWT